MSYIVGTGWWCDGNKKDLQRASELNRSVWFSKLWYHMVNKYTKPSKIIVVDSNSPIKPEGYPIKTDKRIELVSMEKNFGSPRSRQWIFTGGERAFLLGLYYAYLNYVDYFIYIEQDCLVRGEGWIDVVFDNMKSKDKKLSFLTWQNEYQAEWCLCVVHKDLMFKFINTYVNLPLKKIEKNGVIRSELKFDYIRRIHPDWFVELPFGHGRNRPIDFNQKHFYAQQWKEDELEKITQMEGFKRDEEIIK